MTLEQAKNILRIVMTETDNGMIRQAIEVILREVKEG
jgi:hypothetical protein